MMKFVNFLVVAVAVIALGCGGAAVNTEKAAETQQQHQQQQHQQQHQLKRHQLKQHQLSSTSRGSTR